MPVNRATILELPMGYISEIKEYNYKEDSEVKIYLLNYLKKIFDEQFKREVCVQANMFFETKEQALTWYKLYCEDF